MSLACVAAAGTPGTMAEMDVVDAAPELETPEVKLFGKWSCDDVEISDMSLQVKEAT